MDVVEMKVGDGTKWIKEREKEIIYMPHDSIVCALSLFRLEFFQFRKGVKKVLFLQGDLSRNKR
jgi:hypothetical protein